MAVLIEAFSVIVREDAIHEKYSGGMPQFLADIPNDTHCSDGLLSRVGFMLMDDAFAFEAHLMRNGLHCTGDEEENFDIAIGMQGKGLLTKSTWLQGHMINLNNDNQIVTACSLKGDNRKTLAFPAEWTFDQYSSMEMIDVETISSTALPQGDGVQRIQIADGEAGIRYVGSPASLLDRKTDLS